MKRYVLLEDGEEIASANICRNVQAVLFAMLMIAQAHDKKLTGMSWELPASWAVRIGRLYGWSQRQDTLYGLPVRWTDTKEA